MKVTNELQQESVELSLNKSTEPFVSKAACKPAYEDLLECDKEKIGLMSLKTFDQLNTALASMIGEEAEVKLLS